MEACLVLLTAAHIIDWKNEGDLLIPGPQTFRPLSGLFCSGPLPDSGRRDDKLDVGFVILDAACAADLEQGQLLTRENAWLEAPTGTLGYTFAGYPLRTARADRGGIATRFGTCTGFEIEPEAYVGLGLERRHHIAIRFRGKQSFHLRERRIRAACSPKGMSGGGVFAWTKDALEKWPICLPLAGVATEFHPEKDILVATRLGLLTGGVLHMLQRQYPEDGG